MQTDAKPLMTSLDYAVEKKVDLATKSWQRYFVRGIIAAVCLGLGTNASLYLYYNLHDNPAVAKIAFGAFFGFCLIMIVFMNGELFTSNAMYFSAGIFRKKVTWKKALYVLTLCYIANFVGAVAFSWLFVTGGVWNSSLSHGAGDVLYTLINAKMTKPPHLIFLQAIVANLVVNIAVITALRAKDDTAKMIGLLGIVFIFAYFGHEHVIANFASFSTLFFMNGGAGFSAGAVFTNFFFATIGNIIGGGLMIGVVYAWLNSGDTKYVD